MEGEIQVNGTRLWCMLVEYVKDKYYARFYDPSYHRYSERQVFYPSGNLTKSMEHEM